MKTKVRLSADTAAAAAGHVFALFAAVKGSLLLRLIELREFPPWHAGAARARIIIISIVILRAVVDTVIAGTLLFYAPG